MTGDATAEGPGRDGTRVPAARKGMRSRKAAASPTETGGEGLKADAVPKVPVRRRRTAKGAAETVVPSLDAAAFAAAGPEARGVMVVRLYRAFEAQVAQLEERLAGLAKGELKLTEMDQGAKTLASLARTLDTLLELHRDQSGEADETGDPEQMREELARRLGSLPDGGADRHGAGQPDPGGDGVSAA